MAVRGVNSIGMFASTDKDSILMVVKRGSPGSRIKGDVDSCRKCFLSDLICFQCKPTFYVRCCRAAGPVISPDKVSL